MGSSQSTGRADVHSKHCVSAVLLASDCADVQTVDIGESPFLLDKRISCEVEQRRRALAYVDRKRNHTDWHVLTAPDGTVLALRHTHVLKVCVAFFGGQVMLYIVCQHKTQPCAPTRGASLGPVDEETAVWFARNWDKTVA